MGGTGDGDAFVLRKQFVVDVLLALVKLMVLVEVGMVMLITVYSGSSLWWMG